MKKIRVWDLPLRLFHWTLVILIAVSIVSQKIGGNAMSLHFYAGYAALSLVLFRIVWGFIGPRTARFSDFVAGPTRVIAYLRGTDGSAVRTYLGHNPLGSWSVLALLTIVLSQALSGLFANDDIASEGPMVKFVSKELSDRITWFHKDVSGNLIYFFIGLHLAAVAWYFFRKRQNLVLPMFTGDQVADHAVEGGSHAAVSAINDSWRVRLLAAATLTFCGGFVYWVVHLK
ncbi:MAG: cytochrome [Herminiimonas sp.]|nr:cytochrome [Herminiimonas sp.]MDB5855229.1 cytochrome [Herminiimonas sp.]